MNCKLRKNTLKIRILLYRAAFHKYLCVVYDTTEKYINFYGWLCLASSIMTVVSLYVNILDYSWVHAMFISLHPEEFEK